MPVVGRFTGGLDFSNYYVKLQDAPPGTAENLASLKEAGVPVFAYGSFITVALNFVILAFIIFLMVKWINKLKREAPPEEKAPPAPPEPPAWLGMTMARVMPPSRATGRVKDHGSSP